MFIIGFFILISALYADSLDWIVLIRAGRQFKVVFDKTSTKFNDSVYKAKDDPMGTLKGGETYTVLYKGGEFACTGFNQGTNKSGTWNYSNADPMNNQISLWGRVYVFDGAGNVYDPDYGLVGHLTQ